MSDLVGVVLFCALVYYFFSISKRVRILEGQVKALLPQSVPQKFETPEQKIAETKMPQLVTAPPRPPGEVAVLTTATTDNDLTATQVVGGIGVVALVLGVGFFFKYAIDQGWINETARVVLGGVVGGLILALSEIWHRQKTNVGKILTAGAVGVWYFTIFAAYSFYDQIGPDVAFVMLIIVTAIGTMQAYRYSSKELGVVALIGAYLVPMLVNFGPNQQTVLFVYLTLINASVLAVLARRYWLELPFVAIVANLVHFAVWYSGATTDQAFVGVVFVLVNLALVVIIHAVSFRAAFTAPGGLGANAIYGTAGLMASYSIFGFIGLTASAIFAREAGLLALILAIAGVAVFLAYTLVDRLEAEVLNWTLSWVGKVFFVSAIFWQFDRPVDVVYLLLLGLAGLGIGFGLNRRELRTSGASLLLLGSVLAFVYNFFVSEQGFLISPEFWVMVSCWVALGIGYVLFQKYRGILHENEINSDKVLALLVLAAVWLQISWELGSNAEFLSGNAINLVMSLWWITLGVIAIVFGLLPSLRVLRVGGAALVAAAVAKVFLYDSSALEMGYRVVSFVVLGVILIALAFVYEKNKDRLKDFISISGG